MSNLMIQTLNAYQSAVFAKDVDAFIVLYDNDIHVFDMWGTWSLQGIAPWRQMANDWFSSLGDEQVQVSFRDAHAVQAGDLAVGHAILTYTAIAADGSELRALSNRISLGLKRAGDTWKIIHEHTSAPINHQTQQAILQQP
jgi:ketosteroid isomerase-like protein